MQEPKYQSRLKQFRNEIRRTQIQQMKRNFRIGAQLDFITVNDLAGWMRLSTEREYTLQEIIGLKEKELEQPPLGLDKLVEESDLPIDAHIRFWRFFSQQLQIDRNLWNQRAEGLLLGIIKQFTYQEVHHNVAYQLHILNTLQVVCEWLAQPAREKVLDWVAGPEGLRVIQACLHSKFIGCKEYPKVYKVIQLGLKSELRQENEDAAAVLAKILQYADWDQTYDVYTDFHGLAIYLCAKIERYYKDGCTRAFSEALLLTIDSYPDTLLDYARTGAAYTGALLITSPSQASQLEGLCILRLLSYVDNYLMAELLLHNKDIQVCRLWQRLLGSRTFSKSSNTRMRQAFYSFLQNIFSICNREQADELNNRFAGQYEDIFDMLAQCFRDQQNGAILKCGLNCLKSLAYYGQREDDTNILLPILEAKEIMKYIEKLALSGECDVSNLANELLMGFKSY